MFPNSTSKLLKIAGSIANAHLMMDVYLGFLASAIN